MRTGGPIHGSFKGLAMLSAENGRRLFDAALGGDSEVVAELLVHSTRVFFVAEEVYS